MVLLCQHHHKHCPWDDDDDNNNGDTVDVTSLLLQSAVVRSSIESIHELSDDDYDVPRLLSAAERSGTETIYDFSGRVQRLIADSLHIAATSFTSSDKMDFIKQLHTHSRQSGQHCVYLNFGQPS